ncbi:ARI3A protein, partial [Nothoprocta ornata]|nr:ARI3A protein [Nothoprocta ornata]
MKLQAVMENLQRQQRARLQQALEARQHEQAPRATPPPPAPGQSSGAPARARGPEAAPAACEEGAEPESTHMQRAQMAALAAMRAAAAGLSHSSSPALSDESQASEEEERGDEEEEDGGYQREMGSEEEEDLLVASVTAAPQAPGRCRTFWLPLRPLGQVEGPAWAPRYGHPGMGTLGRHPSTGTPTPRYGHPGDFPLSLSPVQLYELDGDPKRKEFLDDLFSFMQKRGTPVNRIPIMAKQVLDLYMLYMLVTEKGGLVEVINKKLWREITKGLNLPTSITSAAFTLRTQYMKYLYPYECEKRGLSNPNELQAAIDSNRREGRRQGFGGSLFTYSPGGTHGLLSSPKLQVPALGLAAATNGGSIAPVQKIKKEEDSPIPISVPSRLPVSLAGHPVVAAQAAAVQVAAAAQAVALEQLREKLEAGEPPEKKLALVTDEQQRLMQRALQQNLLAMTAQLPMSIRINSQGTRSPESRQEPGGGASTNGTNSISMSVEINGVVYTGRGAGRAAGTAPSRRHRLPSPLSAGVLFAQTPGPSSSSSSTSSSSSSLPASAYSKGGSGGRSGGPAAAPAVSVPPSSTSNNPSP